MRRTLRARYGRDITGWLIMLPTLILFAFFVWEPLLESIRLSLYEAQGVRLVRFTGLQNYLNIFRHPDFWPAAVNTVKYCLWSLAIGFLVPIFLAIVINEATRGKGLMRVAVYLPNMVPGLATVFLWRFLFKSGDTGFLNILVNTFGIPMQSWLASAKLVIPVIVVTMTWKSAGATALIYLAGLQGINPELYEAAIIDGAGVWGRLRSITIPNLYNLARTLLILQVIAVFQILYEPMVMTNGGPNNASISLMQLVYRFAFETNYDYAKASALSVMISIALIALTLIYNRVNRPKDL
ncbi:MAG: sugar ABC transporter permease [Oscillospiraceae bacterium]|jgi:multiple sugar transport system permease protein|nr:sugar ABC transporter permease [Oscillospiraceae bacterium]